MKRQESNRSSPTQQTRSVEKTSPPTSSLPYKLVTLHQPFLPTNVQTPSSRSSSEMQQFNIINPLYRSSSTSHLNLFTSFVSCRPEFKGINLSNEKKPVQDENSRVSFFICVFQSPEPWWLIFKEAAVSQSASSRRIQHRWRHRTTVSEDAN